MNMNMNGVFVENGKVVFRKTASTCQQGDHVFNNGMYAPCDCQKHSSFFIAENEQLNKEPIATKKHLTAYQGGKTR